MWKRCALMVAMAAGWAPNAPAAPQSEWVHPGPSGKLVYKSTPAGDRILDFSSAGYMGGGVALPDAKPLAHAEPSLKADDSAAIQAALDDVASRPPDADGLRGAVLLAPGDYHCEKTLTIKASGVVLRGSGSGSGSGEAGTVLHMTGKPHVCLAIAGSGKLNESGTPVKIADAYVPAGATKLRVADASSFKVGDVIVVSRPTTEQWVEFMGMAHLVRDGKPQTWVGRGPILTERRVAAVAGDQLTLDVPLTDSIDAKYAPGATVSHAAAAGRVTQVGVEHLRIVAPPQPVTISDPHHQAARIDAAADVWLRDLQVIDTVNTLRVGHDCRRVTVERVHVDHTVATKGSAKPADFACDGSQVLFDRCSAKCDNVFYLATGGRVTGPIVLLDCTFHGDGHVQPHMRWATGILVDRCHVPNGGIDLMNRGVYGSGHGWTAGWSVAWNCDAKSFLIQQPPGAMNWAIGCRGEQLTAAAPGTGSAKQPQGTIDSPGTPVDPPSLYLAQLKERLGDAAVHNIGH